MKADDADLWGESDPVLVCTHPGCKRRRYVSKAMMKPRERRRAKYKIWNIKHYIWDRRIKFCRFHADPKNRETPEDRRRRLLESCGAGEPLREEDRCT